MRGQGNIVFNRVTARYFQGFRPDVITMAWCVEQRRKLTREEIEKIVRGMSTYVITPMERVQTFKHRKRKQNSPRLWG
jgi:uncharacterized protein YcgL (UPF0745 family)